MKRRQSASSSARSRGKNRLAAGRPTSCPCLVDRHWKITIVRQYYAVNGAGLDVFAGKGFFLKTPGVPPYSLAEDDEIVSVSGIRRGPFIRHFFADDSRTPAPIAVSSRQYSNATM